MQLGGAISQVANLEGGRRQSGRPSGSHRSTHLPLLYRSSDRNRTPSRPRGLLWKTRFGTAPACRLRPKREVAQACPACPCSAHYLPMRGGRGPCAARKLNLLPMRFRVPADVHTLSAIDGNGARTGPLWQAGVDGAVRDHRTALRSDAEEWAVEGLGVIVASSRESSTGETEPRPASRSGSGVRCRRGTSRGPGPEHAPLISSPPAQ